MPAGKHPGRATESQANSNAGPETPVAVGFVSEARFPVSYWFAEELVPIHAVLEEHVGTAETRLLVQTEAGLAQLIRRGRRWYLSEVPNDQESAG
jgi:hypothetical protein